MLSGICNSKILMGRVASEKCEYMALPFGMFLSVIDWHLLHAYCYSCSPGTGNHWAWCLAKAEGRIYPSRKMAQAVKMLLLCAKVKTEGFRGASPTVLKVGMSKWRITAPLNFVAAAECESWIHYAFWNFSIKVGKAFIALVSTKQASLRVWKSLGNVERIWSAKKSRKGVAWIVISGSNTNLRLRV